LQDWNPSANLASSDIMSGRYEGRGAVSGAAVETSAAAIWRVEEGLIVFFQDFATRAEALEAAGLRE
jgi:hypothetical protein